jgi:3-methylcrotonyl-CoA carboxylase alpha subunit
LKPPFTSLLVANRGEIACRIFRTARAMGIRTIAVYSDADAKAKHVREADEAVHIGASAASESYLRGERVLAAAKATGAAAIHPGYGFLSENPEFAEAVVAAGLIWVGPTPAAIRAMGLKDEAKRIAIAAGVPVLAGYQGEDQSEKRLLDEAKAIGFPVLIKAVAGGGGRGIREVKAAKEFKDQLVSAQREAKAAFGDERVLIEKLVERPRHIEVQVFGDKHGGLVHLFERDCSLQRRRQKVIEEAPAPGMTDEVRAAMTDAALKVARAVKYENAGTVEFIVDGNGPLRPDGFWFLEMNTRLQVEHPVTEAITGLDLVEWQLRVAAGEGLPKAQGEIELNGHAIEARICAEDPGEGFRPSVGRLRCFEYNGKPRVDSGFDAGDTISPNYDSLLAKFIRHGEEDEGLKARSEAISLLKWDMDGVRIAGLGTNAAFLARCLDLEDFKSGAVNTSLIAENIDTLSNSAVDRSLAAAILAILDCCEASSGSPWHESDGFRLNQKPRMELRLDCGEVVRVLSIERGNPVVARIEGMSDAITVFPQNGRLAYRRAVVGARTYPFAVQRERVSRVVFLAGSTFVFSRPGANADHDGGLGGDDVKAPLPGKIVAFSTKVGASVKKGDALVTLEAMKMEHALKAPRDGVVAEVGAAEGAQVKEGAVLVRLEPAA